MIERVVVQLTVMKICVHSLLFAMWTRRFGANVLVFLAAVVTRTYEAVAPVLCVPGAERLKKIPGTRLLHYRMQVRSTGMYFHRLYLIK